MKPKRLMKSSGGQLRSGLRAFLIAAVLLAGLAANGYLYVLARGSEDPGPATSGFVSASGGLPSTTSQHSVWFGDINNDSNLDIATAGYSGVRVWTGDGAGNWVLASTGLPTDKYDGGVSLGDINNDGNLDIAAANYDFGLAGVSAWTGDGAGTWTIANIGLPTDRWYTGLFLADVNHDDNLDIAVGNDGGGVKVFLGNGAGGWAEASESLPTTGKYFGVWMADVNNDDNTDLAVAGAGIHIWLGNGAGNWTEASNGLPWTDQWNGICLGDVDLDGDLDLAVSMDMSGHGLRTYLNDGTSNWTQSSTGLPAVGLYYGVVLEDFLGDKYPDLLAANYAGDGIKLWRGDGGSTWVDESATLPGGQVIGVAAGDINSDGHMDIAGVGEGFGVQVWRSDETAPPLTVEVDTPNGGEIMDFGTQHYINWTTSGGTPPLTMRIEYSVNGLMGPYTQISDGEPDDGSYLWTVPNTPSTECFVRVNVTDSASKANWDKSNSSFTIIGSETTPPEITDLLPVNGSVIADSTPAIGASYSDASGIDTTTVMLRVDGIDVTGSATVTPTDVTYTPAPSLSEGSHDVYLEVRDASPLQNLATEAWSFVVDTTPPMILNMLPANLSVTGNVTPLITADYDDDSLVDPGSVVLKLDGIDVTSSATVTPLEVSYVPSLPLSEGFHTVYLEASDNSDPQNRATKTWAFTIDTQPPVISNLQPANRSTIGDMMPAIGANYGDPSGIDVTSVVLKVDWVDVTADATVEFNSVSYVPATDLAEGIHDVYLEVADTSSPANIAIDIWWFIIDSTIIDTTPPTISNPHPVNQSIVGDNTPAIGASYSDASGIDTASVILKVDSINVTASATVTPLDVTYTPSTPLFEGSHDVYLEVKDDSSNHNKATMTWSFNVDTEIPKISSFEPANQSTIEEDTPTIGANYDDMSGIDIGSIVLEVDSIDVTGDATVAIDGITYVPSSPLSDGVHNVKIMVGDNATPQNIGMRTWWFTVDTTMSDFTPPAITDLQPENLLITSDHTHYIAANYSDDSGIDIDSVILLVDSLDVTSLATITTSGLTYTPTAPLSDGSHSVYVEVADTSSNHNIATETWLFTVDTVMPMISIVQPASNSILGDYTPTIVATYSDDSGIDTSSVRLRIDLLDVTSSAIVTATQITCTPTNPLPDGVHDIYLEVRDLSSPGNTAMRTWSFSVDTLPPVVVNRQPANGSTISDSTSIIRASYTDASGIDTTNVILKLNSMDVTGSAVVTASEIVLTFVTPLPDGLYSVYLKVGDQATPSNEAVAMWSFIVISEDDDTDDDGLPDDWEEENFGDLDQGGDDDSDGDGLTNNQEYWLGTDPTDTDTDGDGIRDGDDPNPLIADEEAGDLFNEAWFWAMLVAIVILVLILLFLLWRKKEPQDE